MMVRERVPFGALGSFESLNSALLQNGHHFQDMVPKGHCFHSPFSLSVPLVHALIVK